MKKIYLLYSTLLVCCSLTALGKVVDEPTAKTIGSNYLISNNIPGVKSAGDLVTSYTATANIGGQQVVDYYVFNFAGSKGFVIVSGDDAITPILAYSFQSGFDINNMAPATKDWIEGYQNQITYVIQNNIPAKPGTSSRWDALKVAAPISGSNERTTSSFPSATYYLCKSTWDQLPSTGIAGSYNQLCPTGRGGRTVTGCVATAMAQIMKYWKWPTVGTGSHTYTQSYNPIGYAAQTADFGNTYYNWAAMPDTFATGTNLPIATIMYHAGVSVEMDYAIADSDGSSAYVTESETGSVACEEYALKTYFHYAPTLHGQLRDGTSAFYGPFYVPAQAAYSESAWITMLQTELNANMPISYKGQGADGGHNWVCDGYNTGTSTMFHFNWGWSGTSDGWYTVDNLAPPALGTGGGGSGNNFNTDQGVLIGIEPATYPVIPTGNIKLGAFLDCPASSAIRYDTAFTFTTQITNSGATEFKGSLAVQVFDTTNTLVGTIATLTSQTINAGATSAALNFSTTGMLNMIPGQYYMKAMYQPTGATTWATVADNDSLINYNELDVRNTYGIELFSAIGISTGTRVNIGSAMTVTAQIANLNTAAFSGSFEAVLINLTTGTKYPIQQLTGETLGGSVTTVIYNNYTFSTSAITAPIGKYVLAIEHQPGGTGSYYVTGSDYYENPVYVTVISKESVNTPVSADDISIYPNPASDIVNIAAAGVTLESIHINDVEGREVLHFTPANGQSLIAIPVNDLATGIYFVQLQTADGVITRKLLITK